MVNNETISAVYSRGVLRPVKKLSLAEGKKVEIEIKERRGKKISLSVDYGRALK